MRFRSLRKIESEQMEKVGQYTHPEERFVRCSFQFRLDGSSYLNVLMWPVTSNHNTAIHFPVSVSRFFFLSVCFKRNYWCICAFATVSRPIFIRGFIVDFPIAFFLSVSCCTSSLPKRRMGDDSIFLVAALQY